MLKSEHLIKIRENLSINTNTLSIRKHLDNTYKQHYYIGALLCSIRFNPLLKSELS
jgi:hypothetical protein